MLGKSVVRCVCAAALLLAVSNLQEARAQGRRGGMGMMPQGVSPLTIAGNAAVQKELGVKPEQAEKLKDLLADVTDERNQEVSGAGIDMRALRNASAEERTKVMAQMAEITKKINDKFSPKLADILDKTQQTRLHEIAVQAAGAAALQDAGVVKDLGLSKDQTDKIAAINKDFAAKMREARGAGGGGGGGAGNAEAREEHLAKVTEVLTKEQQAQFTTMKGKAFDLASLRQGRGRRGANK